MSDLDADDKQHLLFSEDGHERSDELLRLTLPFLSRNSLNVNPVNYSLIYHYFAGHDEKLKSTLDQYFNQDHPLSHEDSVELFHRFLYDFDEKTAESFRQALLKVSAQIFGALVDMAGQTSISNQGLMKHIDKLAVSEKSEDVLGAVSDIIAETRNIVSETNKLTNELNTSKNEMSKVVAELESAKEAATSDALTGLRNRRMFDETLKRLIKETDNSHVAAFCLIIIDIDHFKQINDSYGHLQGDKVLQAIGKLLQQNTKGADISARYGGEEFAILLPQTRMTHAFSLAENLRLQIGKMRLKKSGSGEILKKITASSGIAAYRLGEAGEDFVSRADTALYRAKKLGRNRVVLAE